MAITLRNKVLEAKIKAIGLRTGLGPSAVIARAIEHQEAKMIPSTDAIAERLARMKVVLAELPKPTEDDRRTVREAMRDLYDEDGLPK